MVRRLRSKDIRHIFSLLSFRNSAPAQILVSKQGTESHISKDVEKYLGIVKFGSAGYRIYVCSHKRGDEADRWNILSLFGLGGQPAASAFQAVSPHHWNKRKREGEQKGEERIIGKQELSPKETHNPGTAASFFKIKDHKLNLSQGHMMLRFCAA